MHPPPTHTTSIDGQQKGSLGHQHVLAPARNRIGRHYTKYMSLHIAAKEGQDEDLLERGADKTAATYH